MAREAPRASGGRTATLGFDIGGANLKAVHSDGPAVSHPFALWRDPTGLPAALRRLRDSLPPANLLAVAMTGELCDCFESKRQGVSAILDAVESVAQGTPTRVWCNDARFLDLAAARAAPLQIAAANWLALAIFVGRFAPHGPAMLIDIGSTTTDLVPLVDGTPLPRGRTDPQRLQCGELVYTGIRRTPLCALLDGESAAELFATTLDAYLVLGLIAENADDCNTADGRPATKADADARLARMLCADLETSTHTAREQLAKRAVARQQTLIHRALDSGIERMPSPPRTLILAGEGEFLAETIVGLRRDFAGATTISLAHELGAAISRVACAHAVAVLAAEAG